MNYQYVPFHHEHSFNGFFSRAGSLSLQQKDEQFLILMKQDITRVAVVSAGPFACFFRRRITMLDQGVNLNRQGVLPDVA